MTFERVIGGEMAIDGGAISVNGSGAWPTFGKAHALRCDTGRSALKLALADWRGRGGAAARVWLPSYVCPSVNEAVSQLGLRVEVYGDRPGSASWSRAPQPEDGDLVLLVHYFGVLNRPALAWLAGFPARHWSVLEDCVQAPYTEGAGLSGDYAITSLRKWWPAPDGALVCANHALIDAALLPPNEAFVSQRCAAKLLRGQGGDEATQLAWVAGSEHLLEQAVPRETSWLSLLLLAGVDTATAIARRRANWRALAAGLASSGAVVPLFAGLADGETPLVFPVLLADETRDPLRRFLIGRRIYCPIHWQLSQNEASEDHALARRILSLPIDQRYDARDMSFLLSHINEFFTKDEP